MPDCSMLSSRPSNSSPVLCASHPVVAVHGRNSEKYSSLDAPMAKPSAKAFNFFLTSSRKEFLGLINGGFLCLASPRSSPEETRGSSSDSKESKYVSPEEFYGSNLRSRGEKERDGNGDPLLSTFDFLELKWEVEKEESASAGSAEEGSSKEVFEDSTSSLEK